MKFLKSFALATAAVAVSLGTVALAENQDVAKRQALMKSNGQQMGVLGGMAQEKVPYDAEAAKAAAAQLAANAAEDWAPYFVEGSDVETTGEGRALKALWANMDDFTAKHKALTDATAQLALVAGDGLDALKAGVGPVGAACGSCHQAYRKPQ